MISAALYAAVTRRCPSPRTTLRAALDAFLARPESDPGRRFRKELILLVDVYGEATPVADFAAGGRHTAPDPAAAVAALRAFVATVNVTGGLTHDRAGVEVPAADPEWADLADAYRQACAALGVGPTRKGGDDGS